MMGQAIFKIDDNFRRIAEHAEQHGKPILLVKDDGIYLMVDGLKQDPDAEHGSALVAYAEGCNPKVDPFDAWWDRARDIAGGDDFGEHLGSDETRLFARAAREGASRALVEFSETHMTITVE